MKGFVPVTKASLLEMVANCRQAITIDVAEHTAEHLDLLVSREKERMTTRRWYRLWTLPQARFDFNEESVKAYAASIDYPMFEGNHFTAIEQDARSSHRWLDRIERLATSEYAGEPIQLDMTSFLRLSEPDRYFWAKAGFYYSIKPL